MPFPSVVFVVEHRHKRKAYYTVRTFVNALLSVPVAEERILGRVAIFTPAHQNFSTEIFDNFVENFLRSKPNQYRLSSEERKVLIDTTAAHISTILQNSGVRL